MTFNRTGASSRSQPGSSDKDDDTMQSPISSDGGTDTDEWVVTPPVGDSNYRLLVPVLKDIDVEDAERLMRTATMIARDRGGDVLIQCLAVIPEQTPYEVVSSEDPLVEDAYHAAEQLVEVATEQNVAANAIVSLARIEDSAILNVADQHDCDGIVMQISGDESQRRRLLTGDTVEKIVGRADCDLFVEKLATEQHPIESILLTVSGGPHSGLAAETARALELASDAHVDAVHFLSNDATEDDQREAEDTLHATKRVLYDVEDASFEMNREEDAAEAILARSDDYDVTIFGAPTRGLLSQFVFGSHPDATSQHAENSVLMVKQQPSRTSAYYRWIAGETPDKDPRYVCSNCDATFEEQRQTCPDCDGHDIQRQWPENL